MNTPDERDDVIVLAKEAARIAGYSRQGFLMKLGVIGGLKARRLGTTKQAVVYFYRDELMAWIAAAPAKASAGGRPKRLPEERQAA